MRTETWENTAAVRMKVRIKDNTNNRWKTKWAVNPQSTKDNANCPNCILCSNTAHSCHTRPSPGNDWQVGRCAAEQWLARAALQLSQMCLWSPLRRPKNTAGSPSQTLGLKPVYRHYRAEVGPLCQEVPEAQTLHWVLSDLITFPFEELKHRPPALLFTLLLHTSIAVHTVIK